MPEAWIINRYLVTGILLRYRILQKDRTGEEAEIIDYFKPEDLNDASHGELSDRVRLLKCEKEGEDPMCAITQSFVEEGKIIGAVQVYRDDLKLPKEEIVIKIKEVFQLNDYQARTFVYPKEAINM